MTRLLYAGLALVVVLTGIVGAMSSGEAATTTKLRILYIQDDWFENYDFDSQSGVSTNVDWPVDFLFWNNAEIDKVKGALPYAYSGSTKYSLLSDAGFGYWDQDGGRKNIICPVLDQATHYRVYADADDRMYNTAWGFYIIGTSHFDTRECGINPWFGRSEDAEAKIAQSARNKWGSSRVAEDWGYFYNYEPYRQEGNHYWLNDGYATAVSVP